MKSEFEREEIIVVELFGHLTPDIQREFYSLTTDRLYNPTAHTYHPKANPGKRKLWGKIEAYIQPHLAGARPCPYLVFKNLTEHGFEQVRGALGEVIHTIWKHDEKQLLGEDPIKDVRDFRVEDKFIQSLANRLRSQPSKHEEETLRKILGLCQQNMAVNVLANVITG